MQRASRADITVRRDGRNRIVRERRGGATLIEVDGDQCRWATTEIVPSDLLAKLAEGRKRNGRTAPLGDRHGAFVKMGEVPIALLIQKGVPASQWGDAEVLTRILNDPDYRAFKSIRGTA